MPIVPRDINIETASAFDRNWYRIQTVLQIILAFTIMAGLAGLFGGGWLSSDVVKVGPVEIKYDRFARKTVPIRITLISGEQRKAGPLQVTLGRELIEKAAIIRTIPTAASSRETLAGTEFEFAADSAGGRVVISVQPDHFGLFTWKLKIAGVGEASLFQIIYP